MNTRWKAGMWALWMINTVSLVTIGMTQVHEFNRGDEISQKVDLPYFDSDTLFLSSLADPSDDVIMTLGDLKLGDDELRCDDIRLNFEKSTSGEFELEIRKNSRGRKQVEAHRLADAIGYKTLIDGNKIKFPKSFSIPKGNKWRSQSVYIVMKVPIGKTVKLDSELARRVHRFEKNDNEEQPWVYGGKHYWTMEKNGFMAHDYLKKNRDDRTFSFKDFEDVQVEGMVKVNIKYGDTYSISVNGKPKYTKRVEVVKMEKLLNITTDMDRSISNVTVDIVMPKLRSLDLEKTDEVKVSGFTQSDMMIKASTRNEVKALVNVDNMIIKQDDRSEVEIRGKGKTLKASLNDRAQLDTERFAVKVADIKLANYTRAEVAVSDTLYTHDIPHGHDYLRVDGEPVIINEDHNNNNNNNNGH